VKLDELSRVLSHALRHEPWLFELELDDDGWAPLHAVLAALRAHREDWQELSMADIERVIKCPGKRRHEILGEHIRALYGHSVPGRLRREPATPPAVLFHGTSVVAAKVILRDGLSPMSRQYVHLSADAATALEVGRRKSGVPVLIEVAARLASESGVAFFIGNQKVWLADVVPSRFIRAVR
jgi:putative RNA 2'-phosphotransferase